MKLITRYSLSLSQKERILHLWNEAFTAGVSYGSIDDFETYLGKWERPHHILLLDEQGEVQGWIFIFDRDGGRWFSMLLDKQIQGKGYGSKLLEAAKQTESELCGWVVDNENQVKRDGSAYRSPVQFYVKNGFQVQKEERYESGVLSAVKVFWGK